MLVETKTAKPGAPTIAALADAIAAHKSGDPLARATVLVDGHTHDASLRRALARQIETGIAAVEFVTIAELAMRVASEALVAKDGNPLKPVDGIALAGLAQQALNDDPGVFSPRHDHPATAIALTRTIRELRDLTSGGLDQLAAMNDRSRDLVRVHNAVASSIGTEWFDDALAIELATNALTNGTAQLDPIVVFLPAELSRHEEAFLEAAAAAAPTIKIESELLDLAADALEGARIITTADADDEIRAVVREVAGTIAEGTPAHRIAIVHNSAEPYSRLLAEQLAGAEIEFNGSTGRTVRELAPARFLLDLTNLVRSHVRRADLFGMLGSAPVVHDDRPINFATWRSIAIDACANGSLEHWARRLTTTEFQHDWKVDEAKKLADFVAELDQKLAELERASTWTELVAHYTSLLDSYLHWSDLGDLGRAAMSQLRNTLRAFEAFDGMGFPPSRNRLNELLEIETGSHQLTHGKVGIGVRVLSLAQARGLDADFVIVCGCVEGLLPRRPAVEPLLHPDEREALAEAGERVRTSADVTPRQHDLFLHAVGAAPKILLTLPRGDLRKTASRQPSRWVLDIASHFVEVEPGKSVGPKQLFGPRGDLRIRNIGSFVSGLGQLQIPATTQEYRVREAEVTPPRESKDLTLARNAELLRARRSREFTRFDGNLTGVGEILHSPFYLSASALETYLTCPHRFFVERVLGVRRDGLDEEGVFTAAYRGSFIHDVLARHLGAGESLAQAFADVEDEYVDAGCTGTPLEWSLEREPLFEEIAEFAKAELALLDERGLSVNAVELKFTVPFADGLVLHGFIDRVDLDADGAIHITDYKPRWGDHYADITDEDPHAGNKKLQLTLYALAAPNAGIAGADDTLPVETRFAFYSPSTKKPELAMTLTETRLEDTRELIGWVVDAARDGVFPPYVEPNGGTNFCDSCGEVGRGPAQVRREFLAKKDSPEIQRWLALATWARDAEAPE